MFALAQAALAKVAFGKIALAGMALLPSGTYRPLHTVPGQPRVHVEAFALDRRAVTRAEYVDFLRAHPAWRKSRVDSAYADRSYLAGWSGDLDAGDAADAREPVTGVSWYAANAYCAARGKRLPTTDEWEYAAAASETRRDATDDPAFLQRLIAIGQTGARAFRNVYGVSGLHGGPWEWTADVRGGESASPVVRAHRDHHDHHDHRDHHDHHDHHDHQGQPDRHTSHAMMASNGAAHDAACAGAAMGVTNTANYAAFQRDAVRASLTRRASMQHLGFRCAA